LYCIVLYGQVEITAAPTYLVLTLMRFSYNAGTGSHAKIFTDIEYPLTLDVPVREPAGLRRETYGLVAVVVHSGLSSDAGHYLCYARHGARTASAADLFADRWFLFDDCRVARADFENVRSLTTRFSRDTAYVLIYRKAEGADYGPPDGFSTDPPLHGYLRERVDDDNVRYLQVGLFNDRFFPIEIRIAVYMVTSFLEFLETRKYREFG